MDSSLQKGTSRAIDREITVVIPTIGRPILEQCLAAITGGDSLPGRIIVVDQSSSIAIGDMLQPAAALGIETTHMRSDERGRSAGLNRGLAQVTSRFAAITDDDCLADSTWISALGKHLREHPGRVFTGQVTTAGDERVLGTVLTTERSIANRPAIRFDKLSGGNLGLAIDVVRQVGLFDEDPCVRYSEDGEWAYRALRQHVEIAFVPDVIVCHVGWRKEGQRLEQYRGYAHSHAAFFGKHLRRGDAFMLLRASTHLLRAVRRWLSGAVRGDRELAANGRSYVLQFFRGLFAGLRSNIRAPRLPGSHIG
uniref:Glycosyl transferase n=1 Tax=uncultured bacterium ws198A12 TaxID=1131830 RepID=I1X5H8_9BACT|nr:glycosyl transferase [uncultured bacterium ws198A12]